MAGVGTKSVQFDRGYQTELPHSYQAVYGRGSTEIIEGPLYIFVLVMDKLVELPGSGCEPAECRRRTRFGTRSRFDGRVGPGPRPEPP